MVKQRFRYIFYPTNFILLIKIFPGKLFGSDQLSDPHKFAQTIKEHDVHTVVGDKLDKKLTVLTQLHFEIAEISKTVNAMFSFQMLFLMAYGFMAITARIYFVYTGLAGQVKIKLTHFVIQLLRKLCSFLVSFQYALSLSPSLLSDFLKESE